MKNLIQKCVICFLISISGFYFPEQLASQINEKVTDYIQSSEITELQLKQFEAKKAGKMDEVLNIQYMLDKLTGSVTKVSEDSEEILPVMNTESFLDSIVTKLDNVSGIATASEQRGSNSGRMWTVSVGGSTSSSVSDTVYIHYSDNGRTWTQLTKFSFAANEFLNKNEVDCEIIENTVGDKFLYTVFGVNNTMLLGRKRVKYSVTRITGSISTTVGYLTWPGDVITNNYYRPRITSDNAQYPAGAYLYISSSLDSLVTVSSTHRACTKIAQVVNPYTLTPAFTYKSTALSFVYSTGTVIPDSYSDLAYYSDAGTESVIFTESNMSTDTSGINLYKSSVANFTGAKIFVTSLRPDTKRRDGASVCSYGFSSNLFVVCREYTNPSNKKTQTFRTTNSGVNWTNSYTDFSGNEILSIPDISCRRNFSEFYISGNSSNSSEDNNNTLLSIFKTSQVNRFVTKNSEVNIASRSGYSSYTFDNYYCAWAGEKASSQKGEKVYCTFPVADALGYTIKAQNFSYIDRNELHFDLNITKIGNDYMELGALINIFSFDPAFLNGGTATISEATRYGGRITDLDNSFFPLTISATSNMFSITTQIVDEDVNQNISNEGQGTRIIRVKFKTSAPSFENVPLNLNWVFTSTTVAAYRDNVFLNITNDPSHTIEYNFSGTGLDEPDLFFTKGGSEDFYGNAVSDAGDVNGDGYDDFITAGYQIDDPSLQLGRVYIHYGGPGLDNVPDVNIYGLGTLFHMGSSVSKAGDVNNDGFDDIIVTNDVLAGSQAFIYFGGSPMNNTADITLPVFQTNTFDFEGSCSNAGDVNRDGYDDVIIGEALNDDGGTNKGRASIYFGGNPMNNVADVTLSGFSTEDKFGFSVSNAGDVNNDGYSDVIAGAPYNDFSGTDAGRAYIYFGGSSMNNSADVVLNGSNAGDLFGRSVSDAGDVNGDNYSDVIVGSPDNDLNGINSGKAEIFLGSASMNNSPDVIINGESASDRCGYSVSSAGNVNSDFYGDVIVGSPFSNINGKSNSGRARVFKGGIVMDNTADLVLTGSVLSNFGFSVSSVGDVNGDGSDDLIIGAPDYLDQTGKAFIYFSPSYPNDIYLPFDAVLQGFYDPALNNMIADTIRVYLRNSFSPYEIEDSSISVLNSSGNADLVFQNANSGNYYIALKHRNSIETWSSIVLGLTRGGKYSHNFYNSSTSTYGNNEIQVDASPIRYAVYSGDVNQNGVIDVVDLVLIYNEANVFATGYLKTDVNGNNITNLTDLLIAYNNSANFVLMFRP